MAALVSVADGDARAALGTLEVAVALAGDEPITTDTVDRARETVGDLWSDDVIAIARATSVAAIAGGPLDGSALTELVITDSIGPSPAVAEVTTMQRHG